MTGLNAIAQRINIIKKGYCSPNHLTFDYLELLRSSLEPLNNPGLVHVYQLQLEELLKEITALKSLPKILKTDQYRVITFDSASGAEDQKIIDGDLPVELELIYEFLTSTPDVSLRTELSLQKELNTYEEVLLKFAKSKKIALTGIKSLPKKKSAISFNFHNNYVADAFYDSIIDFKYNGPKNVEVSLFIFSTDEKVHAEEKEMIRCFFRSNDVGSVQKKAIQIILGTTAKEFAYFFYLLESRKIIQEWENAIAGCGAFYTNKRNNNQPIAKNHLESSLSKFLKETDSSNIKSYNEDLAIYTRKGIESALEVMIKKYKNPRK